MNRREWIAKGLVCGLVGVLPRGVPGATSPADTARVAPSAEALERLIEAMKRLGEPLLAADVARLLELSRRSEPHLAELDALLDRYTLTRVRLDQYGIGRCEPGGAAQRLQELGWRSFLVRVENPARLTGPLTLVGRFAIPEGELLSGIHEPQVIGNDHPENVELATATDWNWDLEASLWLGYRFGAAPLPALTGEPIEYQVLQLYSQRGGSNSTTLAIGAAAVRGSRQYDTLGYTARFECSPASAVAIEIRDVDGKGTTCSLLISDQAGRVYPAPAHRVEPDLCYQPQIYRADGEMIRLPPGRYSVIASRGPEYLARQLDLTVASDGGRLAVALERWIDPRKFHWYPGDPHVHPEGQVYSIVSKYGVTPETMIRQVRGEGLNVAGILIWTGGYYYEKQFLTGRAYEPTYEQPFQELQRTNNSLLQLQRTPHDTESVIRYDVEQAAFPSNLLGHLVLLRLKNHDWPGGHSLYDWPSWNLPLLEWARAQGAIAGYAHVGADPIALHARELPSYEVPRLFGIGANEAVIDAAHGYIDFLAGGENRPEADLNLWYHLLNCGFRMPMVGETDFVGGAARAGQIRTYVRLDAPPLANAGYEAWAEGIKSGRVYFGDGRSHLMDVRIKDRHVGDAPVQLRKAGRVTVSAKVAARLEAVPFDVDAENKRLNTLRYWHIERARLGSSRKVPLEVVVNGRAVQRHEIEADGELRDMTFDVDIPRSSWVALRILPSSHSAPLIVQVGERPVRASRRSAQWCLDCIEVLWSRHAERIRESERAAAAAAWDHARGVYRKILNDSLQD